MTAPDTKRDALRRLRELFVDYWDDISNLSPLLADAGLNTARIDFRGGASSVWHRILLDGIKSGKLEDLVACAVREFPNRKGDFEEAFDNFQQAIGEYWIAPSEPQAYLLNSACPYPGLRKFKQTDRQHFFGRDSLVQELISASESSPLALVWGHSGSGKSSVVRAGLIPKWLELFSDSTSRAIVMTPDVNPFEAFYIALASIGEFDQSDVAIARSSSKHAIHDAVERLKPANEHWLIFVDQFEELFTRTSNSNLRDDFIASIVDMVMRRDLKVRIVLAMRDDFFGHLREYPRLFRVSDRSGHRVTELDSDSLVEVVERPAAEHGVAFEDGVVEKIVSQVQSRRGMLPLLQYTLRELWLAEKEEGGLDLRQLRMVTYLNLGGVEGALREKARKLFTELSGNDREALRRIMLCTVEVGDTQNGVQPVSRRGLASEVGDKDKELLDRLVDVEKLLVTSGEDNTEFELPHEAIISAWPDFERWVQESQEAIQLRNRLTTDSSAYASMCEAEDPGSCEELWRGAKLSRALELSETREFERLGVPLNDNMLRFLEASRTAHIAEQQRRLEELEKARQAAEVKADREWEARVAAEKAVHTRSRNALYLFSGTLLMGVLALGWGIYQMNAALQSATKVIELEGEQQNLREDIDKAKLEHDEEKKAYEKKLAEATQAATEYVEQRPVVRLCDDKPCSGEDVPDYWKRRLEETNISAVSKSVCSVRLGDHPSGAFPPLQYLGTGFVVAPNLIATMEFVSSVGMTGSDNPPNLTVSFSDSANSNGDSIAVKRIAFVEEISSSQQVVLLEVEQLDLDAHPPLPFSWTPVSELNEVAVFGYPGFDARNPDQLTELAFQGQFGIKRMMFATIASRESTGLAGETLRYDAITSAGCGGAPVVDLDSGAVVGIHFSSRPQRTPDGIAEERTDEHVAAENGNPWTRQCEAVPAKDILDNGELQALIVPSYDPAFLSEGVVPLPTVPDQLKGDLLMGEVINSTHYSFVVNEGRGMPFFIAYNVDRDRLRVVPRRGFDEFRIDPKVPTTLQQLSEGYRNNQFDRGTLIPRSSMTWGTEVEAKLANRDVFYYSIVCPQLDRFNRRDWLKLEQYEREACFPDSNRLCVLTGPVFRRSDIEYRSMRVPRSFWKIIVGTKRDGTLGAESFVMDQYEPVETDSLFIPEAISPSLLELDTYRVSVEEIEELTLLDFGVVKNYQSSDP